MATISANDIIRYTVTGRNAREQLTAATYGSSLNATFGYDTYGYPSSNKTGTLQDYRYVFNSVTGNLTSRENYLRGKSESFTYDNLDRLLTATDLQGLTMTYADNGNLSTKSDIGTTAFSYGLNAGPYALTGVTSSTNVIPAVVQTITYNSLEKVSSISEVNGSQTINASFVYNSDNQRAKMTVGVYYGSEIITRYYVGGSYMKEVQPYTSNEYTYLGGDAYTAPVVVHNVRGVVSYYYLLRDHLGNITHQVNTSNAVVAEFSFDAWGRRRNATNWTYTLDANDKALFADRGFTGHEYLSWYKLYNMNGRLYDPAVGRFLSADPVVQDPGNTQSYNRYSYCLNNPLKYTDPSGYILEQQDMPQDPEQRAAGEEFFRKFSSGLNMGFSRQAGTMPPHVLTEKELKEILDPNSDKSRWLKKSGTIYASYGSGDIWDDLLGKGTVHYDGEAYWGTNFIGPGPKGNPDPRGLGLKPTDLMDYYAMVHDIAYFLAGATGAKDAFFNVGLHEADLDLVIGALNVIGGYYSNELDQYTGSPISLRTYHEAVLVYNLFAPITSYKTVIALPQNK